MNILSINTGSTSVKIERYTLTDAAYTIAAPPNPDISEDISIDAAQAALAKHLATSVDVAVHRIVHLPQSMPSPVLLDEARLDAINKESADAPLHNAAALTLVTMLQHLQPSLAQYAVSDSAFHHSLSPVAKTYALPKSLTNQGFQRIGYHGLSHEYAAQRACTLAGIAIGNARIVTAHLGGGSSLCAIAHGKSIDTTMGFTPLDGVPMETRSGAIDPGLLIHLLRNGTSIDELENMLEHESGLFGISGISGDVRVLLAAKDQTSAQLALNVFAWRVRAAMGALIATLGGVDLIALSGGIGEHAASVRTQILQGGLGLEISLDQERNMHITEGMISTPNTKVPVYVVTAREGWQLARLVHDHYRCHVMSGNSSGKIAAGMQGTTRGV